MIEDAPAGPQHPPGGAAANTTAAAMDDDDDDHSMDEEVAAARAAAEVETHGHTADANNARRAGGGNANANNIPADQAVMGAVQDNMGDGVANFEVTDESGSLVQQRFLQFLTDYEEEIETDSGEVQAYYPYVTQATQMARKQLWHRSIRVDYDDDENENDSNRKTSSSFATTLLVDYRHVLHHDLELAEALESEFGRFEVFLQRAIQTFVLDLCPELLDGGGGNTSQAQQQQQQLYFVAFMNLPQTLLVRQLRMDRMGRLVAIKGTVTRTGEVRPELLEGTFRCQKCGLLATGVRQYYHYTRPQKCRNPRCAQDNPMHFLLETANSIFTDWQKLRLQECSDEIPPGSMPRSMDVVVRNEMVERAKAGDAVTLVGALVVIPDGSALARVGEVPKSVKSGGGGGRRGGGDNNSGVRGLKALGVRELTYRTCFVATTVLPADVARLLSSRGGASSLDLLLNSANPSGGGGSTPYTEPTAEEVVLQMSRAERDEIRSMKDTPGLYERLVDSICPTTFGHREVKKGILLQFLGGVHKTTMEGIKLRGDINVCIVGDPSTAKSQFLKYAHAFLPTRSVYTSGKASSAAGLTAAVQRDSETGEYCIEAGALMLADNGICCIDEFDKMDPTDQVAIHEAMEQQTISITKAGIQATLNARASILAAANPIYGRYDRTKTLKANVALSAPILSRFDLFFVVLDECNPDADRRVARHILRVHRCREDEDDDGYEAVRPPYSKEQMQRYIRFARTIHPKITPESQRVLVDCYRKLRQGDTLGHARSAYRITVRQLESMIRLSEALARLHCDAEIQPSYVREAFRLLKTSIIQVETSDVDVEEDDDEEPGAGGITANIGPDDNDDDNDDDDNDPMDQETPEDDEPETQAVYHPGEYGDISEAGPANGNAQQQQQQQADSNDAAKQQQGQGQEQTKKRSKKKKTKISFEEYEAISSAIAVHLRSLEAVDDQDDDNDKEMDKGGTAKEATYLKWSEIVEWYLEQIEKEEIGDSMERLQELRKKINLVVRRLLNVDKVLVTVGGDALPKNKRQEQQTVLAVHPNYVIS